MPRGETQTWETEKEVFPSKLSTLMKERKISQEVLAEAIGVKRQTVSLYKTGQSKPNTEQLRKISEFFSVSSDWLLGLSDFEEKGQLISRYDIIKKMIARYAGRLNALAEKADQEGVYDLVFVESYLDGPFFQESMEEAWMPIAKRCEWILNHLNLFKIDDDTWSGDNFMLVLAGGKIPAKQDKLPKSEDGGH